MRGATRARGPALQRDGRSSQRWTQPEAAEIEIYIEELVLDGFNLSDRYAFGDALSRELEQLLRDQAPPFQLRPLSLLENAEGALDLDRLNAGSITLNAHAPAASVGGQVAAAVHGTLQTVQNKGNDQNGPDRSTPGKSD